jgi:hypothetical protein
MALENFHQWKCYENTIDVINNLGFPFWSVVLALSPIVGPLLSSFMYDKSAPYRQWVDNTGFAWMNFPWAYIELILKLVAKLVCGGYNIFKHVSCGKVRRTIHYTKEQKKGIKNGTITQNQIYTSRKDMNENDRRTFNKGGSFYSQQSTAFCTAKNSPKGVMKQSAQVFNQQQNQRFQAMANKGGSRYSSPIKF